MDRMRERGLRDVRFITPTAMSYGSQTEEPDLAAVEELLAMCREGIGPNGRVFFGSFPSEIRPEHVSREALRQRDHAQRLAAAAEAYPRPGRSRTLLPQVPAE
ncbi:hypothetical protein ACQPZJ_34920 [Actinoplanes sp. CA-054009]